MTLDEKIRALVAELRDREWPVTANTCEEHWSLGETYSVSAALADEIQPLLREGNALALQRKLVNRIAEESRSYLAHIASETWAKGQPFQTRGFGSDIDALLDEGNALLEFYRPATGTPKETTVNNTKETAVSTTPLARANVTLMDGQDITLTVSDIYLPEEVALELTLMNGAAIELRAKHLRFQPIAPVSAPAPKREVKPLLPRTVITTPLAGGKNGGYFAALNANDLREGQPVWLAPEPDNPYDADAVMVKKPGCGGAILGYIPASLAPAIAATLQNGGLAARIAAVRGRGARVQGLDIIIEVADEGELPF